MNTCELERTTEIMNNTLNRQQILNGAQMEMYGELGIQLNKLLSSIEEQRSILIVIANIAEQAGNTDLADSTYNLTQQLGIEYEFVEQNSHVSFRIANQ